MDSLRNRNISRRRLCLPDERRAGAVQRQGYDAMARVAASLQVQARPTGDTWRPAAGNALAVAQLRALSASFAARPRGDGDLLGCSGVKRHAASTRAMHGLRKKRRYAPAFKLGRRVRRISAVSRKGRRSRAASVSRRGLSLPIHRWRDAGNRDLERTKHVARSCRRCSSPPGRCR